MVRSQGQQRLKTRAAAEHSPRTTPRRLPPLDLGRRSEPLRGVRGKNSGPGGPKAPGTSATPSIAPGGRNCQCRSSLAPGHFSSRVSSTPISDRCILAPSALARRQEPRLLSCSSASKILAVWQGLLSGGSITRSDFTQPALSLRFYARIRLSCFELMSLL
jgi:hypothetical protein